MSDSVRNKTNYFRKFTDYLVHMMQTYMPSSFVLAIFLAILVFLSGLIFTENSVTEMGEYLSKGMFGLLAFTMQMILILITGHALANSPIVLKLIQSLARVPKSRISAVMFTAIIGYVSTFIHWGFGLVAGALMAKEIAKLNYGKKIHYPILVAAAYSGNLARGPSSSIFLGPTAEGHAAEHIVGIVPLTDTLMAPMNILLTIVLLIIIPICFKYMVPSEGESLEIQSDLLTDDLDIEGVSTSQRNQISDKDVFADRLNNSKWIVYIFASLLSLYLIVYFLEKGFGGLNINSIILLFLTLGLFAHKTPSNFALAVKNATTTSDSMILQFPIYAGIMVMLQETGLATQIAEFFISISSEKTLPLFTFYSSSLINFFIPSGGGLWAIQGPIALESAVELGASVESTVIALAWGDTWSSQIQPFWALPLLAIAGLDVKDIMGYCSVIFFVTGVIITAFFLIM